MTEKQYHVQKIYKGMNDGVKNYDWCVMKDDEIILRLTTRMDCKDVVEVLNEVADENEQLKTQLSQLAKSNREGVEKVQSLAKENEQLKKICDAAFELAEEPTQHTLWKFRTFLKEYNSER